MARIYKAYPRNGRTPVVVKLARERSSDYDALKSEQEVLMVLRHPNIVRLLPIPLQTSSGREYYIARALDLPDQPWYIALEYLEGGNLRQRIQKKKTLPLEEAVEWTIQVGRALQHMAEHDTLHLDVKPENIMFRRPWWESPQQAVLIDFGIAKRLSQKVPKAGSLPYIAPERLRHAEGMDVRIDSRADLYSLGVVLYEMLCGSTPFSGDDPRTITEAIRSKQPVRPSKKNPSVEIPPRVEDLVMQMLSKLPGERPSLAELLTHLEREVPHRAIPRESRPITLPPRLKFGLGMVALVIAAALVGFMGAIVFQQVVVRHLNLFAK
jgi:serine/threonine-protein kinase